jgi:CubicO group peptidase (beta-lactamase class C family)
MPNTVTLHPATAGSNPNVLAALIDWVNATWKANAGNANVALVTLSTTESWQDDSRQFVNVEIYPYIYTIPTVLAWTSGYVIGSVQKVFTGTMLAGRILQGLQNNPSYALDSPVKQWLPLGDLAPDDKINSVTLAELATHTSCLVRSVKGEDNGLYCPGGAPNQTQIDAWCNNKNWLPNCTLGQNFNYSNWGSLTLGFAVAQPDDYDYDTSLGRFILPYFGMTAPVTNTCTNTVCVQGYGPGGNRPRPTGAAHGIRTSIAQMTSFVGNYLYYSILGKFLQVAENQQFPVNMVSMALTPPLGTVSLGLDWFIGDLTVGDAKYTLYDKNGMSGAQGFSAYVGFINTIDSWPHQSLVQAGVLVMVNMAMRGDKPSPTGFGRSILTYLFGGGIAVADADDEIDDADPEDGS